MAIGVGAAILAGGLASTAGQLWANQRMLDQQQANNDLSVNLANSAHQREVNDLRAAGLNPILSASGSGSAVPQLGVAEQGNPLAGLGSGVSSAAKVAELEVPLKDSQIAVNSATAQNLVAQNENLRAQNLSIRADIAKTNAETERIRAETRYPGLAGNIWRTSFGVGEDLTNGLKGIFGLGPYGKDYATGRFLNSAKDLFGRLRPAPMSVPAGAKKAHAEDLKRLKQMPAFIRNGR